MQCLIAHSATAPTYKWIFDFKGKLLPVKGKGQKKQKADARQKGKVQAQPSIQNDTEEDVLQDYELSEDSDSD